MIKKIIVFLFVFFGLSLSAKTDIDSLLKVWNNSSVEDTIRLQALKTIAWDGYLRSNPDSTFYYAQLMIDYSVEKGQ